MALLLFGECTEVVYIAYTMATRDLPDTVDCRILEKLSRAVKLSVSYFLGLTTTEILLASRSGI